MTPEAGPNGTEQANQALCQLNRILDSDSSGSDVTIRVEADDRIVTVSRTVAEVLRQVLANTAAGQAVSVVPMHAEFTTQQAADILNVSRPYLVKLLDAGEIEYRKVGSHRRIKAASLAAYRHQSEVESRRAADELTELTEEMGLY
ncbi:DNA-binding protein [Nocardia panacis]|uniref:DNA-binding protein n=2 Tax=Nocardia panacis TaxID=2340916 RepID=A0A3A4KEU7_9NOCA|nr:DNA-binding protein [Nocardia panacis]